MKCQGSVGKPMLALFSLHLFQLQKLLSPGLNESDVPKTFWGDGADHIQRGHLGPDPGDHQHTHQRPDTDSRTHSPCSARSTHIESGLPLLSPPPSRSLGLCHPTEEETEAQRLTCPDHTVRIQVSFTPKSMLLTPV